jgi:glucose/arabinose dehydrogenase
MRFCKLWGVLAFGLAGGACGSPALPSEDRPVAGSSGFATASVAKFDTPWAMAALPGGTSAIVSEKDGRLWVVDLSSGSKSPVTGVPKPLVAGQGGLGDVVVGPEGRIYLSYVEGGPNGTSGAVVGYAQLVVTKAPAQQGGVAQYALHEFRIVWRQQPKVSGAGHFAHRIAFGPDGAMYVTSGDRQKGEPAQDLTGHLGKILRLTPEGRPFPGNPMASRGGVAAEFFTVGHRNPLGIAFAPDGRLWQHEMGPQGGDEVNLLLPGRN